MTWTVRPLGASGPRNSDSSLDLSQRDATLAIRPDFSLVSFGAVQLLSWIRVVLPVGQEVLRVRARF